MSLQRIDFLRPTGAPRAGWVLLAAGVLAWAAVLAVQHRWAAEQARIDGEARAAAEAGRALRAPPPMPTVPPVEQRRWQRAQLERGRPWMAALRAVESATRDPVYLLALHAEAKTGVFRLEGEAPSFDHALAYVQVLPDGVGLASAHLMSHEPVQNPLAGQRSLRFSASAQWFYMPMNAPMNASINAPMNSSINASINAPMPLPTNPPMNPSVTTP